MRWFEKRSHMRFEGRAESVRDPSDEHVACKSYSTVAEIDRAIARLRPVERDAFLLHRIDGLAYDVIAARLGMTAHEVEEHIASALSQLTRQLRRARATKWRRWL